MNTKINFSLLSNNSIVNIRRITIVLFLFSAVNSYSQIVIEKQNSAHDTVTEGISIIPFYDNSQDADILYQKVYGLAVHLPYVNIPLKWTLKPHTNKYVKDFSAFARRFYPSVSTFSNPKLICS